jgi:hypothetical protein
MYFMVVVVAAVDAVDNVSLAKSEPVRRCAYRCVDQKITRGGSWDGLRGNPTCPLIIPRLSREKITVVHNVFPTCVLSTFARFRDQDVISLLTAMTNDQAGRPGRSSVIQRPVACCLIRFVSSVTWLKTLRRSAISVRILRSACMTVV